MIEIRMPSLSPGMDTASVTRWLVQAGDPVRKGDLIAEVETDKATLEVESSHDGVIVRLVAEGMAEVSVGSLLALIDGQDAKGATAPDADSGGVDDDRPSDRRSPAPSDPVPERKGEPVRIKASPLARRLARIRAIDLSTITGSGSGGRIVKADLPAERGADAERAAGTDGSRISGARPAIPFFEDQAAVRNTVGSEYGASHFGVSIDLPLDALTRLRDECNRATTGVAEIALTDLLVKAIARAFDGVPAARDRIRAVRPRDSDRADVAVEISLPDRTVARVIGDAGYKRPTRIAAEMQEFCEQAREGRLGDEASGAADILFSSFADQDVQSVDATLAPPYFARIALCRIQKRPYVRDDVVEVARFATTTGSFDRRVFDERTGAAVMAEIKWLIEQPLLLLA